MFPRNQGFQPFLLACSVDVVLDQLPQTADRKCHKHQLQNMPDLFSSPYKFRIIATETKISGYHKKHRYCKSGKYIGYNSGISRKMDMKKHNCISTDRLYHIQSTVSHKNYSFFIERLSRKYDSGVSFFSKRYTSKPAEFCQCCFSPVRFTLIRFSLVRLPDLNYNSFMTSIAGCLLFPQKGFYFL